MAYPGTLVLQRKRTWGRDARIRRARLVWHCPRANADADRPLIGQVHPDDATLHLVDVDINYDHSENEALVSGQFSNEWQWAAPDNLTEYEYDISTYERRITTTSGAADPVEVALPSEIIRPEPTMILRIIKRKAAVDLVTIRSLVCHLNDAVWWGEPARTWMFHGMGGYKESWGLNHMTYIFEARCAAFGAWKYVHYDATTDPPAQYTWNIYPIGNFALLGL